jgi:hypothetical protein
LSSIDAKPENWTPKPNEDNWGKNVYCIFDPESKSAFVASVNRRMSGQDGHLFSLYSACGLGDGACSPSRGDCMGFTPSERFDMNRGDSYCCAECPSDGHYANHLKVSDLDGKKLVFVKDTVIVPKNFRVIKLNGADEKLALGCTASLDAQMLEDGFASVDVEFDGVDYGVRVNGKPSGRLTKKQACATLLSRCGLSVPDMDELVARAEAGSSRTVRVKLAQVVSPMVGVDMPMPTLPGPGTDPYSGMGLPMEEPYIENQPGSLSGVPTLQDPSQPGFAVGGQSETEAGSNAGVLPDEVMQLADQAAQAGQKHVFDQSTIAGLAGLYDIGYAIDMYVPELTKSLDRIGRILFIFYWKNDEFAERYGEQDLAGIEDLLRNVFKSFGTLVLHLQEKSVADNPREAT